MASPVKNQPQPQPPMSAEPHRCDGACTNSNKNNKPGISIRSKNLKLNAAMGAVQVHPSIVDTLQQARQQQQQAGTTNQQTDNRESWENQQGVPVRELLHNPPRPSGSAVHAWDKGSTNTQTPGCFCPCFSSKSKSQSQPKPQGQGEAPAYGGLPGGATGNCCEEPFGCCAHWCSRIFE